MFSFNFGISLITEKKVVTLELSPSGFRNIFLTFQFDSVDSNTLLTL